MEYVALILGSSVVATLIGKIFDLLTDRNKARNTMEDAVAMLLLGELKRQGQDYIDSGKISMNDLEAYNLMYDLYHNPKGEGGLGGNGFAEKVYKNVNNLPING